MAFNCPVRHAPLLLAALLLSAAAGCDEENALLLTVSAETRVDTYNLVVVDRRAQRPVLELNSEPGDAENPARDISQKGQELKIALTFDREGDYLVHIVGRSQNPVQVFTRVFNIKGAVEAHAHLIPIGDYDQDGDTFISQADCQTIQDSTPIDCSVYDCCDTGTEDMPGCNSTTAPAIHPAAAEICNDGIDQNCDGNDPPCRDADGDGSPETEDCDDNDPNRFPGNPEAANECRYAYPPDGLADPRCGDGVDQDCDGQDTACVVDEDCDTYPPPQDCDDNDASIHPGAPEICDDQIDQNCSGSPDEGCVPCDLDGDGFERADTQRDPPCDPASRGEPVDCDDTDASVYPTITDACGGQEGGTLDCAAFALCDGKDNDCDGSTDEGCPGAPCDGDGDGFMNSGPGCTPAPGMEDCDDGNPNVYPGAPDICGDGILQNCNTDTPCSDDGDGDGYNASVDCNDSDPNIHPGADECCNGIDDDCDGLVDEGNPGADCQPMVDIYCNDDRDGICGEADGGGICVCTKFNTSGNSFDPADNRAMCLGEDLNAEASPRCLFAPQPQVEKCDHTDWDCDGRTDDPNGDNLEEVGQPCGTNEGECVAGLVIGCDHINGYPHAYNPSFVCDGDYVGPVDELCNGLDDDCDGSRPDWDMDHDTPPDGYLPCGPCSPPYGPNIVGCDDCDDFRHATHPTADEICNAIDDNCANGLSDDGADDPNCVGLTCCSNGPRCVDLQTDFNYCGDCHNSCNSFVTSICTGGQCRCGTSAPCGWGQQCVGSGASAYCDCTPTSCPGGCCDGDTCRAGTDDSRCGIGGEDCNNCTNSDLNCTNHSCSCIQNGNCGGCCDGNTCRSGTQDGDCGMNGQNCVDCSASGLDCQNQACACLGGNCNGCCDGNTCLPGTADNRCGGGGINCINCSNSNLDCVSQTCQCIQNSNCPGCCDGNICQGGSADAQCGQDGEPCQNCPSSSPDCVSQSCSCESGGNCTGCCSGSTCVGGTADNACGQNGQSCINCSSSNRDCESQTCQCIQGGNCSGCCSGNTCVGGGSDTACGQNGESCNNCTATNSPDCVSQSCSCESGGNCSGCCDGAICRTGTSDTLCGASGQSCNDCTTADRDCVGQSCQCIQGGNCSGCCDGNNCEAGTSDFECGLNGASCTNCAGSGLDCVSQACRCIPGGQCSGCCSTTTNCAGGTSDSACGENGEDCENCSGSTPDCVSRSCGCDAGNSNCPGCCQSNTCYGGTADNQCGSSGVACFNCTTNDLDCVAGTSCQCILNGQCSGCCDGNTCHEPANDDFCGRNGTDCVDCNDGSPIQSCNTGTGNCQ